MNRTRLAALACAAVCFLPGCSPPAPPAAEKASPPAKVSGPVLKEGELATVTLTPAAESRLGIQVAAVTAGSGNRLRRFAGDVVLPPGRSITVTAAVSGTLRAKPGPPVPGTAVKQGQILYDLVPLLPLPRDLKVTAEADVEQARTRVETAKLRKARADRMLKDEVGTVRAVEDSRNELDLAESALQAATARLTQIREGPLAADVNVSVRAPRAGMIRQIFADPGQLVNAGTPLFEVADLQTLWLRVPVYSGESGLIRPGAAVPVETLSGTPLGMAKPVSAPPTGDPLAATVDFYYEAPRAPSGPKPGERLVIAVPGRSTGSPALQAPWSAVVYDIHGGSWVYEQAANHRYVRHRVQLDHTAGGVAYLASGPAPGTPIVIAGAAELWGVEFGAGK